MNDDVPMLVQRSRLGDRAAASQLIAGFYERIFAYFRRLAGNEHDAADLTQRTFCKAWTSLPRYKARASFNTWLHGIAHHVFVDWLRGGSRLDARSDEWWETCAATGADPFENAVEREAGHRVYQAVEALEEDAREIVHLHYYQSLSIAEIAEALGIGTSTVKYRLRNALAALEKRLAERKPQSSTLANR
jgi:RNA polymerase sigma-70 factor (ECF subfamily)